MIPVAPVSAVVACLLIAPIAVASPTPISVSRRADTPVPRYQMSGLFIIPTSNLRTNSLFSTPGGREPIAAGWRTDLLTPTSMRMSNPPPSPYIGGAYVPSPGEYFAQRAEPVADHATTLHPSQTRVSSATEVSPAWLAPSEPTTIDDRMFDSGLKPDAAASWAPTFPIRTSVTSPPALMNSVPIPQPGAAAPVIGAPGPPLPSLPRSRAEAVTEREAIALLILFEVAAVLIVVAVFVILKQRASQ